MSQCAKSVLFKKSVLREILLPKIILIFFLGSFLLAPFHLFAKEILKGKVTNLPIPRYVSLKVNEANARRGPSLSHKIDWIYKRKNFIEDSIKILNSDKKIIQVWLESKKSASRLDIFTYGKVQSINGVKFRRVFCKEGWESQF